METNHPQRGARAGGRWAQARDLLGERRRGYHGRLAPDFETITDFRRDSGKGIQNACRRFVVLCRELKLFSQAIVAIDGSKFKAVNNRDRNFT